ncbi:PLP-dependent aminotransferase family protein [Nocardia sp. XZ_19_385]|uniref:MocR-like pyridoxine biosynthesis transcription factor PdxR n=1 Tax=Nocardia sp. XZ_19_385 TaxID=2769488 RepID=UPI00188FC96F|nr:PLP-dependent aminotransferase family protein [Nocardia sp. XZ_19_385]
MLEELPLVLDRDAADPLSVQVADGLREAATSGVLRADDRLPSSRALAQQLGVSRTVVAAAYDQLHAEGWLIGKPGSGTYLTTAPAATPARPAPVAGPGEAAELLDLFPGAPCIEALDQSAWRRAWRAAADYSAVARKDRAGEPEYRDAVVEHLLRHRGLQAGGDTMVLSTAGTSSAVSEFANAALRPGDVVAMEDPGYQRAMGAFLAAGISVHPAPCDADGLRVDLIPDGVQAVYCTPAHQFPLGARMPAGRRVELVEFARRTGIPIIEDDYDGELRYDTAPLPLLAAMAPDVVIHLGTTSKILSPALGVGWLVAAPAVVNSVLIYRERTGSGPSPAGQHVFTELARHGDLARHLRRLRRTLPPRRELLVSALRRRGLEVLGDDAGSHVVVPLPSAAAEDRAVAEGRAHGVALDGLARHHLAAQDDPYPRMPFSPNRSHLPPALGRHTFGIILGYAALPMADLSTAVPIAADCLARVAAAAHAGT